MGSRGLNSFKIRIKKWLSPNIHQYIYLLVIKLGGESPGQAVDQSCQGQQPTAIAEEEGRAKSQTKSPLLLTNVDACEPSRSRHNVVPLGSDKVPRQGPAHGVVADGSDGRDGVFLADLVCVQAVVQVPAAETGEDEELSG